MPVTTVSVDSGGLVVGLLVVGLFIGLILSAGRSTPPQPTFIVVERAAEPGCGVLLLILVGLVLFFLLLQGGLVTAGPGP
jgi:hypothetical protein